MHPSTVELIDPFFSYVPTRSLKEPKDLETQPEGTMLKLTMQLSLKSLLHAAICWADLSDPINRGANQHLQMVTQCTRDFSPTCQPTWKKSVIASQIFLRRGRFFRIGRHVRLKSRAH